MYWFCLTPGRAQQSEQGTQTERDQDERKENRDETWQVGLYGRSVLGTAEIDDLAMVVHAIGIKRVGVTGMHEPLLVRVVIIRDVGMHHTERRNDQRDAQSQAR
jgi:hypothetical protein